MSLPPGLGCCTGLWNALTSVLCHYVPGDLTGQVLAYISLLPIAILVGFVTLIVFKRELHTVSSATAPSRVH